MASHAQQVKPDCFEPPRHYYPRTLNAQIHPTVANFFHLSRARLIKRYCHINPRVDPDELGRLLGSQAQHFHWFGSDLFQVTTPAGIRQMVVIETNSCPSGQKSMPLLQDTVEDWGYRQLLKNSFIPLMRGRRLPPGDLAVIYDKNHIETSGYAASLATISGEPVWLIRLDLDNEDPPARFTNKTLEVRDEMGRWHPIRAAFRYITQKPWSRIPLQSKTLIYNSVLTCLAGGRNKMLAAKAYQFFNAELRPRGLRIRTPETIWNVGLREVPLWVQRWGGLAVVKNPYSNAGQGVWTITNEVELQDFMKIEHPYDQFIVQSLIGNFRWSSEGQSGRLYHVGTMPNKREEAFAADLRVMVCSTPSGFKPLAIYGRRARLPLPVRLPEGHSSWGILGTNLSVKHEDGRFSTEPERLMLMDRKDFNMLGLGIDDLVDAFVQTVLSGIAIDRMSQSLLTQKGNFRLKLFGSMNNDPKLMEEIIR